MSFKTSNMVNIICLWVLTLFLSQNVTLAYEINFQKLPKPRVIVLTDITNEPDDEESMVRFLVYSNEYDVEGLIATTSVWLRNKIRPENIIERVKAYGKVRNNLLKHAPGFATAEHLLSVVKSGRPEFGMEGVGKGKSSEGSNHIISVVDKADNRPVWISVWGGANCLAQSLWDVRDTRSRQELDKFVAKLRVYTISDQDNSGRWMRHNFHNLFYIVSPSIVDHHEYHKATWTGIGGDRHYKNAPGHKFHLVQNPWLEENIIKNHGPLGALYPRLAYIMEGDTPSFIGLISNGLGWQISPSYGGWAGRYVLHQVYGEVRPIWSNVRDSRDTVVADNGIEDTSDQATIWRWREDYQHDFAARMDWNIAEQYEKANHNPVVALYGDKSKAVANITAKPGETIKLDATGTTDPDGDKLTYKWFQYKEAGTLYKTVQIKNNQFPKAELKTPNTKKPGTIHIICQVKDNGNPALFSYRRAVINITLPK